MQGARGMEELMVIPSSALCDQGHGTCCRLSWTVPPGGPALGIPEFPETTLLGPQAPADITEDEGGSGRLAAPGGLECQGCSPSPCPWRPHPSPPSPRWAGLPSGRAD